MSQYSNPIVECSNCGRLVNVSVNHDRCPECRSTIETHV